MFPFPSSSYQRGPASLMEMSRSVGPPPPPAPPQFLRPHSSPQLPLGCKACKEIGVLCCISLCLGVSPLPNLVLILLKNSSRHQRVLFLIPEKEQINRYILNYYAHSSLILRSVCKKESFDSQELSWLPRRCLAPLRPSPLASERGQR